MGSIQIYILQNTFKKSRPKRNCSTIKIYENWVERTRELSCTYKIEDDSVISYNIFQNSRKDLNPSQPRDSIQNRYTGH